MRLVLCVMVPGVYNGFSVAQFFGLGWEVRIVRRRGPGSGNCREFLWRAVGG